MAEILAIEMATLLLAVLSIGVADMAYHGRRIAQRLHSLWVATSISATCLPILCWTATIFIGPGSAALVIVAVLETTLFVALYRNLCALPEPRKLGQGVPPQPPVGQTDPPAAG